MSMLDYAASIWDTGRLWQNGLAAVPVALIVAAICRWAPCRPATRHLLWLVVLLVFLVPQTWLGERARDAAVGAASWTREHAAAAWDRSAEWLSPKSECRSDVECEELWEDCDDSACSPHVRMAEAERAAGSPSIPAALPAEVGAAAPSAIGPSPHAPPAPTVRERPRGARGFTRQPAPSRPPTAATAPVTAPAETSDDPVDASCPTGPGTDADPDCSSSGPVEFFGPPAPPSPEDAQSTDEPLKDEPALLFAAVPGPQPHTASAGVQRREEVATQAAPPALWGPKILAVRDAIVALPPIPSAIWAGGVAALVAAAGIRTLVQARMLKRATPAPADVRRMVSGAAATLGLSAPPETWMVTDRISPMVWCGFKRRLLLPAELWRELDETSRSAVVMHELAHLRRRDHWTCWAELVACAVYWWHPVVWWVRRRLREEADLCCDAWVTALFPMERRVYAQALLETRKYISRARWSEPAVGLSATAGGAKRFARRLTMVMTQRTKPGGSWTGVALAAMLAGAGLATGPLWACPPEEDKAAVGTPAPVSTPVVVQALTALSQPTPVAALAPTPSADPVVSELALLGALAPQPGQPDSTFERHMAARERGAARSRDLEALLEAAGERLDALDDRLEGLRELLESAGEAGEAGEAGTAAMEADCEALAAQCEAEAAACEAAKAAQHACGDECAEGCACSPCDDSCAGPCGEAHGEGHGAGHSFNGDFDATVNGRALVLIVGNDGRVNVYRVREDQTESLVAMLDSSGGPLVVSEGQVAVNGANVNAMVADEVRERVARAREAQREIRAAQRARLHSTMDVYRRQVDAYKRAADEARERAEEMQRKAEEMESRARSMNDEAPALPQSERRRAEANAQRFSRQSEQMRQTAEQLQQQAEQLLAQAEQVESQADAAREQAEAEAEAAAEQAAAQWESENAPDADLWDAADEASDEAELIDTADSPWPVEDVTEPAFDEPESSETP